MMRVLIDTHVFLWLFADIKISQKIKDFLLDTKSNEIYVSHVTAWEISIKYGVGKLKLPEVPELFVPDRIRRAGFLQLPIKMAHVLSVHGLPPIHKDPFDRLLVSQAKAENLTILTADPNFPRYKIKTLDVINFSI
jgi:PIN domain nuclease of toxin-antitoxin system